nr:MAG TPA: hypothetical protein [Crassvirales sp.]
MSDINNIKVGSTNPDSILFNKYKTELANSELSFGSIIPRDNSLEAINSVSNSIWQVNDGWEVEIINSKKLAIKKFKIDTWGIRQMIPNSHTNYNKLRVRVTGLTRVHQNVICHTAGSTTADGFTKAYGGTAGYDVYWYPGHYTSGNSMQGMVIQFGCGYTANDNERVDSLQIGKHPWDVGTKVGISDGIIEGTWGDTSYKAITIGLYGGVQNAKSWHDETGDAYKQYDISDNPIYIDLDVDDVTKDIDVTSVECWDAYTGNDKSYHKDKTIDNCWKKYGLAVPFGWNLYKDNLKVNDSFTENDVKWQTPFRLCINKVSESYRIIANLISINNNYYNVNFKAFYIKGCNIKTEDNILFNRVFNNADIAFTENLPISIRNGLVYIKPFKKTINRKDNNKPIVISEFSLLIAKYKSSNNPAIIDIIPIFEDTDRISINTNIWNNILPNMFVPEVTDYLSNMNKITWNNNFSNTALANSVKNWYKNNPTNSNFKAGSIFRDSKKLTDITILLPNENWLYGEDNFSNSELETITIKQGGDESHITSPQRLFRNAKNLKNINIVWSDSNNTSNYLCGANSVIELITNTLLTTYPERLINWNQNRSHILDETIQCTLFQYAFDTVTKLITIPSYPSSIEEDNTIVPARNVEYAFNECKNLKTVGPIFNMILVNPKTANKLFNNCNVLSSIRIKNLNHGNWNFDGVTRDNMYHGTLKALDVDSVKYLFDNLADLTTHNSSVHEDTIDKSFKNWSSDYFNQRELTADWDYTLDTITQFACRKRHSSTSSAPFIVHTNQSFESMNIIIEGLKEGNFVTFGSSGAEADYSFNKDGKYTIKKVNTEDKGFKLISTNTNKDIVNIRIENGLDYTNPTVSSANLYCPKEWDEFVAFDFTTMRNEYLLSQTFNKITFNKRKNTSRSDTICWIEQSFNLTINVKVEGLIAGDTLGIGQGNYSNIKYKITDNGSYKIEFNSGYRWGFKLWNDSNTNDETVVSVSVDNTPAKVTTDMISAANVKGWKVFINGVEKK